MLPKNSIITYHNLVQKICIPAIKPGQRRQFIFGFNALASRPFVSLCSNARTTVESRSAAESKMARLLRNLRLQKQLTKLHLKLVNVNTKTMINVDHSEFNGLSVLMFAAQTRSGRAIPVYLQTIPSLAQGHKAGSKHYAQAKEKYLEWKRHTGHDQYSYTTYCIGQFIELLGFKPNLVFDRGFCNKRIMKYLKSHKITFYIRARSSFCVKSKGIRKPITGFGAGSYNVSFGCKLRLIVGTKPDAKSEPWYIFTNNLKSSSEDILTTYYYRFEIEELFRDMKSILNTSRSRLKNCVNLATLLWFVCLGVVLLRLASKWPRVSVTGKNKSCHPKKKLSDFRAILEEFERQFRQSVFKKITLTGTTSTRYG